MAEVARRAAGYLAERGCASARLDADLLLALALGVNRLALYTDHERPLTPAEVDAYRALIARRGRREPVAYILGSREFRRVTLRVGPGVLVPRPETELLVEWALEAAPGGARVLDWGTGSGAIARALADERPDLALTAVERSPAALALARENLDRTGVELVASDGFAALGDRVFEVIAANPPYLSRADLGAAEPELRFEPEEALVAGPTGWEALAALADRAPAHLAPGGWLLAEIGAGQADGAVRLWRAAGLARVAVRPDLAGIGRVVGGMRSEPAGSLEVPGPPTREEPSGP